jgi:hypothetical protein
MQIAIIGSRRRASRWDYQKTRTAFLKIYRPGDVVVSGGCPSGGDLFAEWIAAEYDIEIKIHHPDKTKLDRRLLAINPRAAYAKINYARNKLIAWDADIIIAVVARDRTGGTEDTIRHFCRRLRMSEPDLIGQGKLILV